MALALEQAQLAAAANEVPVGAVLIRGDQLIASGHNRPISNQDPSAHAEIVVLREAARAAGNYRLPGTTLYVTVEPCTMCVGALVHARVARLVFGAREPRSGAVASNGQLLDADYLNHRVQWHEGVLAAKAASLMKDFFRQRRD